MLEEGHDFKIDRIAQNICKYTTTAATLNRGE